MANVAARHSISATCSGWPCVPQPKGLGAKRCLVASHTTTAAGSHRQQVKVRSNLQPQEAPDLQDDAAARNSSFSAPAQSSSSTAAETSYLAYKLLGAIGSVGALETAYLSMVKLFDSPLVCPTSGCETVLSSSYSMLFGIPLPVFGMVTYTAVAAAAFTYASSNTNDEQRKLLLNALAVGVALLAGCSSVLMYILNTEFAGSPCGWCYLSAGLSFTALITLIAGTSSRQLQEAAAPSLGALASAIVVLYFGFGSQGTSIASSQAISADFELKYEAPIVQTTSSSKAIEVAKQLRDAGAKMYGAFWCSHCYDQKQVFGQEAMEVFPYVECYPDGWKRGKKLDDACEAAGVQAFPTWVINGRTIEGGLSVEDLQAELAKK